VFGRVVDGMNVVDDIGAVATGEVGPLEKDAPLKAVIIIRIEELKSAP
jgi:cyclophilin family peptidyl-prolyl cis-trans isomerase